jgi:streptogramin lyase
MRKPHFSILLCLTASLLSLARLAADEPIIKAFAGTGEKGYAGDGGPAASAQLNNPFDVALDAEGNLFFSDTFNHCVRRVDAKSKKITTVAGKGKKGYAGDGGAATAAMLNEPYGIEVDRDGNLFIVDRLNYCIRRVGKDGKIDTIAGTGKSGYSGDGGPGKQAGFKEPNGLCLDTKGKLYVADVADQRVRVLDLATGKIDTFCGDGKKQQTGDGGPFKMASLFGPRAVAMGPDGNLYICEREGNAIRRVDFKSGKIERVAGTGKKGYTGDGSAALEATFNGPKELDIDKDGNIYVVDTENQAIRKIDAKSSKVSTVAGSGKLGNTGDGGPATKATLGRPHGVVAGPDGSVYIGDTQSHKIRVVSK